MTEYERIQKDCQHLYNAMEPKLLGVGYRARCIHCGKIAFIDLSKGAKNTEQNNRGGGLTMKRLTEDGRLRRYCADQQTKAERTIQLAVDAVETIGAAPELTEVVMMLGNAREKLADYLEGIDGEICEHNKEPDHE